MPISIFSTSYNICWKQRSFFKINKYFLLLNLLDGTLSHLDQQSGIRCFTNRSDNLNPPCLFITQRLSAFLIVHKILLSTTAINPATKSCADLKLWRQCPNPALQGLRTNYWTQRSQITFCIYRGSIHGRNRWSRTYRSGLDCQRGR